MSASRETARHWHAMAPAEAIAHLGADPGRGLTADEASRRLARDGPNRVEGRPPTPLWLIALRQFRSLVIILLLLASGIAFVLGERVEAAAILVALGLNAGIGFVSEWKARISLDRLRSLAVPYALVRRDGEVTRVASADLVRGDIVVLEQGGHVPADLRLIRATALRIGEAALTGESVPIFKDAEARLPAGTPLAERSTMAWLGTSVVAGSGVGVVTSTGDATELGRIGELVKDKSGVTPLERQVESLGRRLMVFGVGVCGVVALAGILQGQNVWLMLETALSLAVAAVPEGLPAVTTLALAAGLWRLARAGALVRRLPAVETLGSTTVICADKTGTLTENQMTAVRIVNDDGDVSISGGGRDPGGAFRRDGATIEPLKDPLLEKLLVAGVLVNDAALEWGKGDEGLHIHGDPTEGALLVAALKAGLDPERLRRSWPRRLEYPFDPKLRYMATVHGDPGGGEALFVKGAPEVILGLSTTELTTRGAVPLTGTRRGEVLAGNGRLAGDGLRVLALAFRPDGDALERSAIRDLCWLGLVAIADPLREGVVEALEECVRAGIRTVMLTGDQRTTAEAIGRQIGLSPDAVRSRMSPEQKLDLVEELKARGEIVAMTGDGVNDAPALARADIGVAMGRHGTDVAREAADLVLTDDNFRTIVRAVKEGRVIDANLRKVIRFLFSCNVSEILVIFTAIVLAYPAPLLPLQILWINLVTDILPALALIRDPAEPDVMTRGAREPARALISWRSGGRMLFEGAVLASGVLGGYLWAAGTDGHSPRAGTIAFMAIVLIHPLQALNCRSGRFGWWRLQPNHLVWITLVVLVAVQWIAVSWPPLAGLLRTVPLTLSDWMAVIVSVVWPVALLELIKSWRTALRGGARARAGASFAGETGGR